ncbi:MAG: oligosaccharide flippase family protein [Bacteroidales bacterium]|nr:oligosaccharide flippase family protein [Bacteroidales bacterium]
MKVGNIGKGAIISYVSIFVNIAISFFYTPWMIRQIGMSDYGLYSLIMSFISYFLMDFGLHQAVQRFIAKYRAENNEDKVAKMVGLTTRVYLIIDAVIFLVLLVCYFFISNIFTGLNPSEINTLKGLYIIAAVFSILNFMFKPMAGAMLAYEFFVEEKLLEMVNRVGTVVLVCVALLMGADVYALVLINGAVALLTSFLKFIVFKRKSKLKIQWGYYDKGELKGVFSFSMWTFGISLAQRLRISLIPTILGIVSNSTEIAVFALSVSLDGMIYILSSALNGLFLPKVARVALNQDRESIGDLMIKVGRIQLYIIWLIFSGFCIFGSQFIHLWVGDAFKNAYYILICGIAIQPILLTEQIANDLVYVENKVRYTGSLIFVTSLIGFGLATICARSLGALGAGFGTGIGLIVYIIWLNIFYKNNLKLNMGRFFKECHGKILPILATFSILSFFLVRMVTIDSWFKLFGVVAVYTLIYFVIAYCFTFNKEEKDLVKALKISRK